MEIDIMSIKLLVKEVIGSYADANGDIKEVSTIIGEAWVHKNKLSSEQLALLKGVSFDIRLKKNAQQELVTELDYLGNEKMVMRPVPIKAFPAEVTKPQANVTPSSALLKAKKAPALTPTEEVIA
jgi:hypothetical protein